MWLQVLNLAFALAKTQATEIIGIDISKGMLDIGKKVTKSRWDVKIKMEIGDSEKIAYPANYFDAVAVAFGGRNFENLDKGLSEILRVLRPGGDLIILKLRFPKIPNASALQVIYPFCDAHFRLVFQR